MQLPNLTKKKKKSIDKQIFTGKGKVIILILVAIFGYILPFVTVFVFFECVVFLIPLIVAFVSTMIYSILSLLFKWQDNRNALFLFAAISIFQIAQFESGFCVDKIQRFRSEIIIADLEKIKAETGYFPEKYDLSMGLEYGKVASSQESFIIRYTKGFFVVKEYYSQDKRWQTWND